MNEDGRNRRAVLAAMTVCFVASAVIAGSLTLFGATKSAGPLWIFVGAFGAAVIIASARFATWRADNPVK